MPSPLSPLLVEAFDPEGSMGTTFAVVVVHRGRLVAERYGGVIEHLDRAPEPVGPATPLLSWSMAKSMLHAVVGQLVDEGRLDPASPAPVGIWQAAGDERASITLEHLLTMRDGLDFTEDYVDAGASDVIEMLWGAGKDDVARFAADRPLRSAPGTVFNYSSGTSNIVSGLVAQALGGGTSYEQHLQDRLFAPLGMRSATPGFDAAGTWIASSFVHATAQDFARFGLLYLRDGVVDGERVLPAGWVDHARRIRSHDADSGSSYGALWWAVDDAHGRFWANGYEGQRIVLWPALDVIVVRLGKTPIERAPALRSWIDQIGEVFAAHDGPVG